MFIRYELFRASNLFRAPSFFMDIEYVRNSLTLTEDVQYMKYYPMLFDMFKAARYEFTSDPNATNKIIQVKERGFKFET